MTFFSYDPLFMYFRPKRNVPNPICYIFYACSFSVYFRFLVSYLSNTVSGPEQRPYSIIKISNDENNSP